MEKQMINLQALSNDLEAVLKKHGFTAGYVVAEVRDSESRMARFCGIGSANVEGAMPSEFLMVMSKQTFEVIRSVSNIDLTSNQN